MNTLKRSLLFLNRNKGKSILLFCLIFLLSFSAFAGFSIVGSCNTTEQNIIDSTADSFDVLHNRVFDYEIEGIGDYANIVGGNLTTVQVEEVCRYEGVLNYNAHKKVFMDTSLYLYGDKTEKNSNAYFYAVNETELHDFFRNDAFGIIEGRHIAREDENVCVISKDLADLNDLKVGDMIYPKCTEDVVKTGGDENNIIVEAYPMEIIGIYKMNFEYSAPEDSFIYELPQNIIFADHISTKIWHDEIAKATNTLYSSGLDVYEKVTFFVDDIKNLDAVMFTVNNPPEPPWLSLDSNSMSVNDAIYYGSLSSLNTLNAVTIFVILPVLAGIIIFLFIISSKSGKSRKKEYVILLKSGFAKKQIFAQRFLETGIIALIAFVIALVLVSLLITPVSDGIKAADAARVFEPYTYEYVRADIQFGPQITQNGYLPDDFGISMNLAAIVWGIVIVFAVTVISALISASSVLKKKPFDIAINSVKDEKEGA